MLMTSHGDRGARARVRRRPGSRGVQRSHGPALGFEPRRCRLTAANPTARSSRARPLPNGRLTDDRTRRAVEHGSSPQVCAGLADVVRRRRRRPGSAGASSRACSVSVGRGLDSFGPTGSAVPAPARRWWRSRTTSAATRSVRHIETTAATGAGGPRLGGPTRPGRMARDSVGRSGVLGRCCASHRLRAHARHSGEAARRRCLGL